MSCQHILFSKTNVVPDSQLSTNVEPVLPLDHIKNHFRDEPVMYNNFTEDTFTITGDMPYFQDITYFAIPGHNFLPSAEIKLELFDSMDDAAVPIYDSGFFTIGEILPLGIWAAGVNAYGEADQVPINNLVYLLLDQSYSVIKWRVSIKHRYGFVKPEDPPVIVESDGIYRQDPTTGVLAIEAENGVSEAGGGTTLFEINADASASGGTSLYNSGFSFHDGETDGPKIRMDFTASQSGTFKVWWRIKPRKYQTYAEYHSFYTLLNGHATRRHLNNTANGTTWTWVDAKTVTLSAGQKYTIYLSHRHSQYAVDRMVIQPSANSAPTGQGPAESTFGTKTTSGGVDLITSNSNVSVRMIMLGETMTLEKNFSFGNEIQFFTEPDLHFTQSGFPVTTSAQKEVRRLRLSLDSMTPNDRYDMRIHERSMDGAPFFVSAFPDKSLPEWMKDDYTMLAIRSTANRYKQNRMSGHSTELHFMEV